MKERIVVDLAYVKSQVAKWAFFERVAKGLRLDEDAAWCECRKTQWGELLECFYELEKAAL